MAVTSKRRWHLVAAVMLAALAFGAYANSFRAGFALDNHHLILGDPRVHQASAANLRRILGEDYWASQFVTGVYRPLTTLSFLLNYAVLGGGDDPVGYHVVNLVLHWANALLVWVLAQSVLGTPWLALFVAAIFAVHPIATEAVTNIVGRADLLATLAVLAGLLCHLAAARASSWRRPILLAGVTLAMAIGLLAKESAVVLPGLMLVADLAFPEERVPTSRLLAGYLALLPSLALLWLMRTRVYTGVSVREVPFLENPLAGADFWTARLTALKVFARYVALLVWPQWLSCDYSFDAVPLVHRGFGRWEDQQALVGLGLLAAALVLVLWLYRRERAAFFFLAFFLIAILPVSNLLAPIGTVMAERLVYLPSIGFAGCVVVAVYRLSRWLIPTRARALSSAVLALIVAAYGLRTVIRNRDWHDDLALFRSTVRAVPGSFKAHMGYASALAAERDGVTRHVDTLIEEAERAVAIVDRAGLSVRNQPINPRLALADYYKTKAMLLAGDVDASRGWNERAAAVLEAAVAVGRGKVEDLRTQGWPPRDVEARNAVRRTASAMFQLGDVYDRLGDHQRAAAAFVEARTLVPAEPAVYVGLARAHFAAGRPDAATVDMIQLVALEPGRPEGWRMFEEVLRRLDPARCRITFVAGRPRLEPGCAFVEGHACSAYQELIRLLAGAGEQAPATQLVERLRAENRCPHVSLEPPPGR